MIKKTFILLAIILVSVSCTNNENGKSRKQISTPYYNSEFIGRDRDGTCTIVYITRYGQCFHSYDCYTIQNKNTKEIDRCNAEDMGKRPCKKCNP